MTISRVNGAGWGIGDKLTSSQANGLDLNTTYALDKRAGQTDTLESRVELANEGRIFPTPATGANADTTYYADGGNLSIRVTTAVTANRAYTLSNTGAVAGDQITIFSDSSFAYAISVKDNGGTTIFLLGNTSLCDGGWATFVYVGGAWRVQHGGQGSRFRQELFTADGTWTSPRGVTMAWLIGVGGGGGGGGGAAGTNTVDAFGVGGSGGGGALLGMIPVTVTAETGYAVVVGAGGTGGAAGYNHGQPGSDTTFGSGGSTIYFKGAGGGYASLTALTSATTLQITHGGGPAQQPSNWTQNAIMSAATEINYPTAVPGGGGFSGNGVDATNQATDGARSTFGNYAGGARGARGTDSTTIRGGGGGGGGGAGPFGAGGAGGAGGNGNNAGAGGAGVAGTAAGANSGAGGGGGGAGGAGTSGGAGAAGGAGGSGLLIVCWVK